MQTQKPTFREAFLFWLKLGFISFGGSVGQIAIMHDYLVTNKKWISESKFMHALNYCMFLPGPEAQQLATYTGWLLYGVRGGLIAGIFFVLPSMFILLGLCIIYTSSDTIPWLSSIFIGLKPAVVAIVILALVKIGSKALKSWFQYGIAALIFVGIFFFKLPFPLLIGLSLIAAFFYTKFGKTKESEMNAAKQDEESYFINSDTLTSIEGFSVKRLALQISIALFIWLLPFLCFLIVSQDKEFWKLLILFFTKAAFVTFGGAYAVLPYVAQVAVEEFHWLSSLEMIDGLALGETTPGPLVMVLAFVGFMAGYNHFDSSLLMGSVGLIATTFYTFVPCFLFIFAGAPIIEKTQESPQLKGILSTITATVVGMILNLALYLGSTVIFPRETSITQLDYIALTWILISLVGMKFLKIGMIPWIGISAVFGLIVWFA